MVGIVIVSHSYTVGEGIVEFCKELKNHDFTMLNASGMGQEVFGTNPLLISESIERSDTGDGVIVLCDLGSSVMSSQMAIELLSKKHNVVIADAPLIEGAIVASSVNSPNLSLKDLHLEILETRTTSKL